MKKHTYTVYIPENIGIDPLLTQHPLDIPHAKDYLTYIMHLIHAANVYNKDVDVEDTGGYTILKSTYLQDRIRFYKECMSWLLNMGILECNGHYIPGSKSMGYRFTPSYRERVRKTEITTYTLIKSILSTRKRDDPKLMPEDLPHFDEALTDRNGGSYSKLAEGMLSYLHRWISDKRLVIDIDRARSFLDDLFLKELNIPNIKFPVHRLNYRWILADQLHDHIDRFHVDDTSGRLHTLLTCLMSELRAFLTYDGQALVAADIKSSQPYLSLALLDPELLIRNKMLERISRYDKRFSEGAASPFSLSTMVLDFVRESSQAEDVIRYREIVLTKDIYVHFGGELKSYGLAGNREGKALRDFAKTAFLTTIYNDNAASHKNHKAIKVFKNTFPNVFRVFEVFKSGNYKALACALQNLEAEVVLHGACKEIAQLRPEIPMFTVHDSIATTAPYYDFVHSILTKHLEARINAAPKIKGEEWDDSQLSRDRTQEVSKNKKSKDIGVCYYGYADDSEESFSLIWQLKQMGLMPYKAMAALRHLNVLSNYPGEKNRPMAQYIDDGLFQFRIRNRRGIGYSPRTTYAGIAYLEMLIAANPDLFPKNEPKVKKESKRGKGLYFACFLGDYNNETHQYALIA